MIKQLLMGSAVAAALILGGCGGSDDNNNSTTEAAVNNPDIGGGKVLFYTTSGEYKGAANVGNLPDMVAFSHDGSFVVTANEGEPNDDYTEDPKGSISIVNIDPSKEALVRDVTTLYFDDVMIPSDVRIKPDANASVDLEPEYVAINATDTQAMVTLQENNAIAMVDLENKVITAVKSLGTVSLSEVPMDIAEDDVADLTFYQDVYAMYQPDTIVSYNAGGVDYYVTANEGDDREYDTYEDYEKLEKLDGGYSTSLQALADEKETEDLRVFSDLGQDANGTYTSVYIAGTRSFSIWSADGTQVYNSDDAFENYLATGYATYFNTRVDDTDDAEDIADLNASDEPFTLIGDTAYFWEGVDARSPKKGAEPEALSLATIGSSTFAYIGLEKQGGFFVYNITDPVNPTFVEYVNDIDYTVAPGEAGDLAPEGMVTFEQESKHYLAIANELSSTVALYALATDGSATKLASLKVGSFDEGAAEILSYDAEGKQLFVTNAETSTVDIISVTTPATPMKTGAIDFSAHAEHLQSVSVKNGMVAIAVE